MSALGVRADISRSETSSVELFLKDAYSSPVFNLRKPGCSVLPAGLPMFVDVLSRRVGSWRGEGWLEPISVIIGGWHFTLPRSITSFGRILSRRESTMQEAVAGLLGSTSKTLATTKPEMEALLATWERLGTDQGEDREGNASTA